MANAPGLRFTDGTTTVTVSDGTTGWLVKYEAKNKRASDPEVTEQATALLIGGISAVRTTVESLNKLFQQAEIYRQSKSGPCVYVERLTESAGSWWRSELVDALPVPEPSAMDWGIVQGKIEISLIFTRKNWWEGDTLTELAISSPAKPTAATGETPVYFPRLVRYASGSQISFDSATKKISDTLSLLVEFQDGMTITVEGSTSNDGTYTIATGGGAHAGYITVNESLTTESAGSAKIWGPECNYIEIGSTAMQGDLPGRAKITIKNNAGSTRNAEMDELFIGHNFTNSAWATVLEAEERDSGGTITYDSTHSKGAYTAHSVGAGVTSSLLEWILDNADLVAASGRWFRPLVRFKAFADVYYRFYFERLTTEWTGPWQKLDGRSVTANIICPMSPIRIPNRPDEASVSGIYLRLGLEAKNTGGSTATIEIDYLLLLPTDGYRELYHEGGNVSSGDTITDDGFIGLAYEGSNVDILTSGKQLMIYPGKAQKIHFDYIDHTTTTQQLPGEKAQVRVYYRPRKLTLT